MSTTNKIHLHWFCNDLRISDQHFSIIANKANEFVGLYIIDSKRIAYNQYGFRNMSLMRLQVLREHLLDLEQQLNKLGGSLVIKIGNPIEIVPKLVLEYDASLSFMREYATDERKTQNDIVNKLKSRDIFTYDGNFLLHPENVDWKNKFPSSFSKFRKIAEKRLKNHSFDLIPRLKQFNTAKFTSFLKPSVRKMDERSALPFRGGESRGKQRLNNYLFETKNASTYKETRNGLLGRDYSTKLSFWLSVGALSPSMIMNKLREYENIHGQNKSTYWIFFELLWRDYFRHAGKHYEDTIFIGLDPEKKWVQRTNNNVVFENWKQGKTEEDFVNANMVELESTGFMSNRGRQNVASYLVHDHNQNWLKGARWFEHCLLDYDVYSNQGNWGYVTGVFFNPNGKSEFDIKFQEERYDPKRKFIETWLKN